MEGAVLKGLAGHGDAETVRDVGALFVHETKETE